MYSGGYKVGNMGGGGVERWEHNVQCTTGDSGEYGGGGGA